MLALTFFLEQNTISKQRTRAACIHIKKSPKHDVVSEKQAVEGNSGPESMYVKPSNRNTTTVQGHGAAQSECEDTGGKDAWALGSSCSGEGWAKVQKRCLPCCHSFTQKYKMGPEEKEQEAKEF